jgi:DNA-binding CsgD family transcriptional regulator
LSGEKLEAVLDRLQTTKSIDELQVWAHELRDALGVAHVFYHTANRKGEQVGVFTYDVAWIRRYVEKNYSQYDPVVLAAARRFMPMDWKSLDWSTPQARQIMREAIAAGVGTQGWSIPIWGPGGQLALFVVNDNTDDASWEAFTRQRGKELLVIAHSMHQHATLIVNDETEAAATDLSPREKQALIQLSRGQGRAEVAAALHISENTLRAYIDSARHKLGAMNVTHAVAIALARGIIVPHGELPKY